MLIGPPAAPRAYCRLDRTGLVAEVPGAPGAPGSAGVCRGLPGIRRGLPGGVGVAEARRASPRSVRARLASQD